MLHLLHRKEHHRYEPLIKGSVAKSLGEIVRKRIYLFKASSLQVSRKLRQNDRTGGQEAGKKEEDWRFS